MSRAASPRRRLSLCLAHVAIAGLAGSAVAALETIDDFSDRSDQRWERLDATGESCPAFATFDASSEAYLLESGCALEPGDDAFLAARYLGDPLALRFMNDGYARVALRHLTYSSNGWLSMRSWGDERLGLWGYRYEVSPDGSRIAIVRSWEHGSQDVLAEATFFRPLFQTGDRVMIEAGAVGNHLSLKVWSALEPEPAAPQLIACDRVLRSGDLALGVSHAGASGALGALYDDVQFRNASADLNGDGAVDFDDVLLVMADWGGCLECPADINGDGFVDAADVLIVIQNIPGGSNC